MVGGMAGVTITKDSDGVTSISDYGVKALVCHVSDEKGGIRVFPLRDYPEELAAVNAIIAQDSSFSKEQSRLNHTWLVSPNTDPQPYLSFLSKTITNLYYTVGTL